MSLDSNSTKRPVRPSYPQRTRAEKAAMAVVAVLLSSTLLGSILGLFEMRSEDAAMARAPTNAQPSSDALAVRNVDSGSRG